MMRWLGQALTRRSVAWLVVALVTALAVGAGFAASNVERDDDVLAFLPADNEAVKTFDRINERFGGLNVALVGIPIDDPLDPTFFGKLQSLTKGLDAEPTIAKALSLSNVEDFVKDPIKGGVETNYLVPEIPSDPAKRAALKARIMSLDHIVGNVIAKDGRGVIVYCFLQPQADPRMTAALIRNKVQSALPDQRIYWGGAPFVAGYIYDITERDMRRLIPWSVALILLIVVLSFRDPIGSILALGSTGLGILFTYGWMGHFGIDANIVLSSMPVILFAIGSAYGTHILVRYYKLAAERSQPEALAATLEQIGPTVMAAGLTTVAGLLSFIAMDIEPMQQFGVFTSVGIFSTLLLSLTFVPAVITLTNLKSRRLEQSVFRSALIGLASFARRHRTAVAIGAALLAALGATFAGSVEARMENRAFFSENSPPAQADRFLQRQFGGSLFIQVAVTGDMNDPLVLRQVQTLADRIAAEKHVSAVVHIGQVLAMATDALAGERRIPTERRQIETLYRFVGSKTAVQQLVTYVPPKPGDGSQTNAAEVDPSIFRNEALIHVKIDTDRHEQVHALLGKVEALVRDAPRHFIRATTKGNAKARARRIEVAFARIRAEARVVAGLNMTAAEQKTLRAQLAKPREKLDVQGEVERNLVRFLRSEESMLEPEQHGAADALAKAMVGLERSASLESLTARIKEAWKTAKTDIQAADDDEDGDDEDEDDEDDEDDDEDEDESFASDLAKSLKTPLEEIHSRARARALVKTTLGTLLPRIESKEDRNKLEARAAEALLDLDLPWALLPHQTQKPAATSSCLSPTDKGTGCIRYEVSGVPVLYRGLSESVTANQLRSLAFALLLVLIIMMVLFRSIRSGLLAAAPTVLTLLVIYGVMGVLNIHLDIGTSMLASIIIGAGVDYAVHLLAAWHPANMASTSATDRMTSAACEAAEKAGPSIWTNALMVGAGFFVLTLGEARPLQTVGGLTAAAMVTAALATFLVLPALCRREHYRREQKAAAD